MPFNERLILVDLYRFVIVALIFAFTYAACFKLAAVFLLRKLGIMAPSPPPTSRVRRGVRYSVIILGISGTGTWSYNSSGWCLGSL